MSKSTTFSFIGFLFAAACAALIVFDFRVMAGVAGLVAFVLTAFGVKTGSAKWKVGISILAAGIFGFALCPKDGLFCMMACMLLIVSVMSVRLLFFEHLAHARLKWLEPLLLFMAAAYYVFGNIYDGSGWISWALPAPGMAFAGFMVMGMIAENKELASRGIIAYGVEIGKLAPGFSLPDQDGNIVNLSDFKNKRNVLLIFVRGDWCPTCHIMLRSYEKNKEKFAQKNIMLLAVGPDNVEVNKEMVVKLGLDYKLLSDSKLEAVKAYGMQMHGNNPMTKYAEGIPLPASFLVDANGNVLYTSNPQVAGQILNPETIFPIVEKLQATA